jgi:hypothetical protein
MENNNTATADKGCIPGYGRCIEVLERERELVAKIAEEQNAVRKAVINRQWTDFEARMKALGDIGAQFEEMDQERVRIFASISGSAPRENEGETAGFYALVSRFPEEERKTITGIYRNLKMEITKIRLENDSLMNYLSEAQLLVKGFLDAAFPDRKGRIYSRNGAQVKADMRSMVLNRRF